MSNVTVDIVAAENALIDRALSILEDRIDYRLDAVTIGSSQSSKDYIRLRLAEAEQEIFGVLFLDTSHRVIEWKSMFYGTIDSASVYPREIVKAALSVNAAAVVLAHNHPSGISEPSSADKRITKRIGEALSLIDVRVLDHIIIGADTVSFAELGLI